MKSYSVTDVGQKRQVNQDFVFASEEPVGNLPNLFIVADGMGGHNAGDFASSFAVQTFLHSVLEDENQNPIKIIRSAIEEANRKVLEKARTHADMSGMGTTMVLVTVVDDYAYVANVGDSRLYLIEDRIKENSTLLLCSDGLSNMVSDEEIWRIANTSRDLREMGMRLVSLANENGGKDNIAVVLVQPDTKEVEIC